MARVLKGSHSFTSIPRVYPRPHLPTPEGWKTELALVGWLHTEINARNRELNPDTVTHPSTNRTRRTLTSLIEANALTTTPRPPHLEMIQFHRQFAHN